MASTIEASLYVAIKNQGTVRLNDIPVISYSEFYGKVMSLMQNDQNHCVTYHAFPQGKVLKFICCIANDLTAEIKILSHEQPFKRDLQLM